MGYRLGGFRTIADGTAAPSGGGVGTSLNFAGREERTWSAKIVVVASGAYEFNLVVWRRDKSGAWARLGPSSGDINGGSSFAGSAGTDTYELGAEFLGLHEELYFQASNATNVTSLTVSIAPYAEGV